MTHDPTKSRRSLLVGLLGAGIQASRTPALHEQEGAELGLRYVYRTIDLTQLGLEAQDLPELLIAAERLGYDGLNVTIPCKQAIIPLLHEVSEDAAALGAVNTVLFENGRRIGHNTDWWGFAQNLRRTMSDVRLDHVVLLGAGGGGSAVAYALLKSDAGRLTILDVDGTRAARLAAQLGARFGAGRIVANENITHALATADGVVNATPMGMATFPGTALPTELLHPGLWVADIVYFPLETALLAAARARGCRTLDGGGMAVMQAAGAFRLFTGIEPDARRMRRHFAEMVSG
ncbi:MAG: shikimate dehydrogenase [Geminicoccaceae bacterium]|nr:shikimate dehydrogenase [Geminicoccaceae bacterium]